MNSATKHQSPNYVNHILMKLVDKVIMRTELHVHCPISIMCWNKCMVLRVKSRLCTYSVVRPEDLEKGPRESCEPIECRPQLQPTDFIPYCWGKFTRRNEQRQNARAKSEYLMPTHACQHGQRQSRRDSWTKFENSKFPAKAIIAERLPLKDRNLCHSPTFFYFLLCSSDDHRWNKI